MALKSGVFACLILASSLSCTVMAQRHTGLQKDSVTTTAEPDQNTLNVQIEKLQAWNFSKYANCAVRQRPARMGRLPISEEEYVVLAERALKIWYAAILAQPMKKLDISIHFWSFLAVLSFYIIWLGFSGRFLVPETLLGCKNLGIILPMKSWTSCGIAIFWTRATTPTSSNSWGQLGICHLGMRKPTIWHSIWVFFLCFPILPFIIYIYTLVLSFFMY